MRVLFVIQGGVNGGVETLVRELTNRLRPLGFTGGVAMLLQTPDFTRLLDDDGIPWWHVPVSRSAAHDELARDFEALLRDFAPDVVHAFTAVPIAQALPMTATGRPEAARVAGVVGAMPTSPLLAAALDQADAIVVDAQHLVSGALADMGVTSDRVEVITLGTDSPAWMADPSRQPPVAVCVANFLPIKGHELLIKALHHVQQPLTVRLCGHGPSRSVVLASCADLPGHVRVEAVPIPADVPQELRAAQFAIQPSVSEGWGLAVTEELAAGLPVIASAVGGHLEQVEHGRSGLLVPRHPAALAASIDLLAASPQLRADMGQAARQRAEVFAWEPRIEAHAELYRSVLAGRARPPIG